MIQPYLRHLIYLGCASFLGLTNLAYADQSPGEIKVIQLVKTTKEWDGTPLPPYPTKNPEISILRYEIPPGIKLPMHKHPVINAGVILQGELTVISKDGKQLILKSGDSIVEVVDKWHYGFNSGVETAKLIVFYVGEVGVPLAIKE
ncbi:MAG: cupin domain-containing protein [Cytophagales bacterium]|nr:cupin domain-containing protein [Cytophagales bacterium]